MLHGSIELNVSLQLKQYSLDNTFFNTHAELQQAVKKFLRYRNARNKKKNKSLP